MFGIAYILNKLKKDYNISYSRTGFYKVGLNEGWLTKVSGRYFIDDKKFKQWVDNRVTGVPNGWMSIDDIAKELNVGKTKVWKIVTNKKNNIPQMKYNLLNRKKAIYADIESIKKFIERNKIPFKW